MTTVTKLPTTGPVVVDFRYITEIIKQNSGLSDRIASNWAERLIELVPSCVERTDVLGLGGTHERMFSAQSLIENFSEFEEAVHEAHFMYLGAPIFGYLGQLKSELGAQ